MPPRFAYWTIIVEGKPTAFRAQDRDELVPTFKQLQSKHPDAVMMWFARGRLWTSPDEARAAERGSGAERRGKDWRPGGEHRDPRARFEIPRDEKRRRFAERMRREERERSGGERDSQTSEWRPKPDRRPPRQDRPGADRPWRPKKPEWKPKPQGARGAGSSDRATRGGRPFEHRSDRPPREEWGPRPREDQKRNERPWKKPDWKPRPPGAPGAKPDWKPRPPGAHGSKSGGGGKGRPSSFRPRGPGGRGPGGRGPGGRGPGGKPPGRGGRGGGGSR